MLGCVAVLGGVQSINVCSSACLLRSRPEFLEGRLKLRAIHSYTYSTIGYFTAAVRVIGHRDAGIYEVVGVAWYGRLCCVRGCDADVLLD